MKTKNLKITLFLFLILGSACSKKDNCPNCIDKSGINGKAQKGPFLNGSSVTLSELDDTFTPTGNSFNTNILDNSGTFSFNNVSLVSSYANFRVDGFYFNEVCGQGSASQITLNGIVDLNSSSVNNLNVLTHLEKARVEYLLSTGTPFSAAKAQAQTEVLNIFNISPANTINNSEILDISGNSEGDAILIAVSSILQGFRSESEFSDLMANIITDIRTDGVLNSSSLGSQLLAHANLLDTIEIANNIQNRYNDLGISVTVPSFGYHIENFMNTSSFSNTLSAIDYPTTSINGPNILDLAATTFTSHTPYSLSSNLPNDCLSLKIKISRLTGACQFGCWVYNASNFQDWVVGTYDHNLDIQEFTASGTNPYLAFEFWDAGTFLIEYFENNSSTPTRTKTVTVN